MPASVCNAFLGAVVLGLPKSRDYSRFGGNDGAALLRWGSNVILR